MVQSCLRGKNFVSHILTFFLSSVIGATDAFSVELDRDAHACAIVALKLCTCMCVCVLARTCIRDAVVGRVVGIAKAPGHTSINTGLSLLVWVLSGQGVSPGKQLANRQSAT